MIEHVWSDFREDIDRYADPTARSRLLTVLTQQGLWVLCQYRISRWVHYRVHVPGARQALKLLCFVWRKAIEITTHCEFPNRAEIGPGILLTHAHGIVIHVDAVIGRHCNIGHQVTIGVSGRYDRRGTPRLGDRVFIGPGAKLLGPIGVGNDVAIGANAVVTKDLPDYVLVVGVPARVVALSGSNGLLDRTEVDPPEATSAEPAAPSNARSTARESSTGHS